MKDLQQKLLATFQIEHREHVEHIRSLLALMAHTGAAAGGSEFEEIFRRAHSLKGAARAVDVQPVEQLAHRLETLFSRVRQGACTFDAEVERVTQQVLDATEDCMATLAGEPPAETVDAALRAIGGVLGINDTPAPASAKAPAPAPIFQPIETLRVSAGNFDGLLRTAASMSGEIARQDQIARELAGLVRNMAQMEQASAEAVRAAGSAPVAVRTALETVDRETRAAARQARAAHRGYRRAHWSLGQLGRRLQSDVRQARMAPAENLLEGYRRMMRDLARDEGREIRFDASCASVQADRRVLDALKDPIMHLLRNAVSHGIEPAAARMKKGKKAEGLVTLRIDADGQRLIVTVEDDGAGVDFSRVAEIAGGQHQNGELARMLFRPGFTTASSVTTLAGRGMGLSVVDETVRRLQGEVSLEPRSGSGTRVTLAVPLSIATHRLIVVRCGAHVIAIPVPGIERLRKLVPADVESAAGRPMLGVDGEPLPLAGLEELVEEESQAAPERHALVLRSGSQRVAVAVDEILDEADAAIQDLAYAGGGAGLISSGAVLDDGTVALVVNPAELVRGALQAGSRPRPESRPAAFDKPAAPPAPPTILVVDDSMTTRALEKSILEAHGYRVRIAVDGVEALARLREEAADLVISDIEMPRLDGFGLIEAMKQDPALEKIPVIVVSSVERREDRERGLSTGADAYIVKRRFDQEELLGVIRQIL